MAFEEQQPFDPASFEHIPVLLNECLTGLATDPAGTYLDGTAGGAGHSRQIALRLNAAKGGRLISLDQDPDAVQTARSRLAGCLPPWCRSISAMRDRRWSSWALKRSTAHCWILAFPATSWTMPPGAFPTGQMPRWTCG